MPKIMPKNKRDPLADPNASRKHLKPDFPLTTRKTNRDMNRKRGVSAMRSTGPRKPLSVSKWALPVPESDPIRLKEKRKDPQFDRRGLTAKHGLWGFFYEEKKALVPPETMGDHGREWTYTELSLKSFEDLHALYWIGHKERNRIATNTAERTRVHAGYGDSEDETRSNTVEETMSNIRDVLRDRYEAAEEAYRILDSKPLATIDLDEHFDDYTTDEDVSAAGLTDDVSPQQDSFPAQDPPTKLRF